MSGNCWVGCVRIWQTNFKIQNRDIEIGQFLKKKTPNFKKRKIGFKPILEGFEMFWMRIMQLNFENLFFLFYLVFFFQNWPISTPPFRIFKFGCQIWTQRTQKPSDIHLKPFFFILKFGFFFKIGQFRGRHFEFWNLVVRFGLSAPKNHQLYI